MKSETNEISQKKNVISKKNEILKKGKLKKNEIKKFQNTVNVSVR